MKLGSTLYIILLLLCANAIHAQGIFQLWGLTKDGGSDNTGAMFSTTASGTNFQERHQFNIINPGAFPQLTDLVDFNGKLYGMTQQGGNNNSGIIFEWDPATNTYSKKISFTGVNGSGPLGSLVMYEGKFYGMTESGGGSGQGVIFEWDPSSNIYAKKTDFVDNFIDGFNGYKPAGNLTISGGKFYGMTSSGGNHDKGVIFEWDPETNIYTKKIDFNGTNGSMPYGSLTLKGGNFYGMTLNGGTYDKGVIFEWDPETNVYTKKLDFTGSNGAYPFGNLMKKGTGFISMTQHGGINDGGIIFEWDPAINLFTKKYEFDTEKGYWPSGNLTLRNGKYYSMAFRGGINDVGVIFEWDPALNSYKKLIDLNTADGKYPQAGLTLNNGKFYGMTSQGGDYNKGVIFEWDVTSNIYTKKINLNDIGKGINPSGSLKSVGGKLYGMTNVGGSNNTGVIFEWDQATKTYSKKIDFNGANGSKPTGSLSVYTGKLYGMTKSGGDDDLGVIFEWDPATNIYTKKINLTYENGCSPQGSLELNGGKFYGMTSSGGSNGLGVIFEWDPATNIYTKKVDFISSNGSRPYGNLSFKGGKFYGMTYRGGSSNVGVIFEWDPVSNILTKKIDMVSANGISPAGSLTLLDDKFYGLTSLGGTNNKGVIFEWNPATNIYTKKFNFSSTDASVPLGSLTGSVGKFYGMTRTGGANNGGVIFEWDPATNVYTKTKDLNVFSGGVFPGIINNLSLIQAPVAKGSANNCVGFNDVTINSSNNNVWVPITDEFGDAVAEIKANGNNLGLVSSSMYINNGSVREDGANRLYLDRNLTITPQFQPATAVDIRLYLKGSEYLALKNAVNSFGMPSGINNINDVSIYKNNDGCIPAADFITNPVATNSEVWDADYVLSGSIGSFSSFYFSSKAQGAPLPITRLDFKGSLVNTNAEIIWKTTDEFNTHSFLLERSEDGRFFKTITQVAAINQTGVHTYYYTDKNIISLSVPVIYYRLKQTDLDGKFVYSGIVALQIKNSNTVLLYPNPVAEKANLNISINKSEQVLARIIDNTGRVVKQQQLFIQAGSTSLSIDVSNLASGIYYLELKGETMNEHLQFFKR